MNAHSPELFEKGAQFQVLRLELTHLDFKFGVALKGVPDCALVFLVGAVSLYPHILPR